MTRLHPFLLLGLVLGAPASCLATPAPVPCNPASTPRVQAILSYIAGLENVRSPRLLTGQFTGFARQGGAHLPAKIHQATGKWPALLGVDYADFDEATVTHAAANATALAHWRSGGLVSVSVHLYNPVRTKPRDFGLRDKGVNLDDLLLAGSPANKAWLHQLDLIAGGLQELRSAGVVVLWRPFHEMNGGWFWWGAKDPAAFRRLWRHMWSYFSQQHHLDNLLWVFSPNHGPTAGDYYPGDDVVDITGLDAYTDHVDPDHIRGYPAVSSHSKPFGFTEFGPHGAQHPPGDFDYRRFLAGVRKHFPRSSFFLSWDENWSPANNLFLVEFYSDPALVSREDLPKGLVGQ